jgi:hypothetical protein
MIMEQILGHILGVVLVGEMYFRGSSRSCCLYCAVVLGEKIFYETWLFLIIEMRVLLGFISLDDFI